MPPHTRAALAHAQQMTEAYTAACERLWETVQDKRDYLAATEALRDVAMPYTLVAITSIRDMQLASPASATAAGIVAARSVGNFVDRMWVLVPAVGRRLEPCLEH